MNKYQSAINFLYSTFMYDERNENIKKLDILNELVIDAKPLIPYYKVINNNSRPYCGRCGLRLKRSWNVCPRCGQKINWGKDERD